MTPHAVDHAFVILMVALVLLALIAGVTMFITYVAKETSRKLDKWD